MSIELYSRAMGAAYSTAGMRDRLTGNPHAGAIETGRTPKDFRGAGTYRAGPSANVGLRPAMAADRAIQDQPIPNGGLPRGHDCRS
jgi:hypothetical protein